MQGLHFLAPATMAREEVRRVGSALEGILRQPQLQTFFADKAASQVTFRSGADTQRAIREELAYWGPVIPSSGYKPE